MERNTSTPGVLKYFRYLILVMIVIASLASALLRFSGGWSHFWTVQAWFIQAVFGNLNGGWIAIGPGGLSRDVAPWGDWHWR